MTEALTPIDGNYLEDDEDDLLEVRPLPVADGPAPRYKRILLKLKWRGAGRQCGFRYRPGGCRHDSRAGA